MADLVGPKFKIGDVFWTGVTLEDWLEVHIRTAHSEADKSRMDQSSGGVLITLPPTPAHEAFLRGLKVGSEIHIEEGRKLLKVKEKISASKVVDTCALALWQVSCDFTVGAYR